MEALKSIAKAATGVALGVIIGMAIYDKFVKSAIKVA